jgi:very-short-patch-repair endonuclease
MKFRRQATIGPYIVDFLCYERRLIIELDGGQHNEDGAMQYDQKRTDFLDTSGFLVLRFWNTEIFENIEGVLQTIVGTIHPHLNPPPQGEDVNARGA